MLLILTNSKDATADYVVSVLRNNGMKYVRLDTDTILRFATFSYTLGSPVLRIQSTAYRPGDFTHLWYRRPERLRPEHVDDSPEQKFSVNEWTEALEGFLSHIPIGKWTNHPARNAIASNKINQLTVARSLGFSVPQTLVTQDADELREFYAKHQGAVVAKPLAAGYIERDGDTQDSLIYTNQVEPRHLVDLSDLPSCPTLFQQRINKRCDVRITVVDEDIYAVQLLANEADGSQRCDIRRNNMEDVRYEPCVLPSKVRQGIRSLMQHYGLRFGAIDMAVGFDEVWHFFEINPNGQWAWLDLAGASRIADSFLRAFRVQ